MCLRPIEMATRDSEVPPALLEARGVCFSYPEGEQVLHQVSIDLREGELLALVGSNGAGKTTLAKSLNGLLRPDLGTVRYRGQDVRGWSVAEIARRIGFVFQNPDHQILGSTVYEELAFGPRNLGIPEAEVNLRVETNLQSFRLEEVAEAPPALLSFGLRRLISVASVLTMDPEVLILDEPTKGLDAGLTRRLTERLQDYCKEDRAILLITHDMALVAEVASRCGVMREGRILAMAEPRRIFSETQGWQELGIETPQVTQLAWALNWSETVLTVSEFLDGMPGWLSRKGEIDAGRE